MRISGRDIKAYEIPYKAARHIKVKTVEKIRDITARRFLKKISSKKKKNKDKIRVGFIVQMPEIWDKASSVFNLMLNTDDFEPMLIIVPAYDFENSRIGEYDDEKKYFINSSDGKYILAKDNSGRWVNIEPIKFDYIFYQRPYNNYLPKYLRSYELVKYTKLCYIPYATTEIKKTVTRPKDFFSCLYIGFMEDSRTASFVSKQYYETTVKGYQHFISVGYPAYENCFCNDPELKYKNFLWTPRWTYDTNIGGSHFFEYHLLLEELNWNDAKLTIRPHPMMWDNFVKNGLCTHSDVQALRDKWKKLGIREDHSASIEETFKKTDVLISDMSSVIAMFFMSGKPIIFCPKEPYNREDLSFLLNSILPGLYIARDEKSLRKILAMLINKNDPLKDVRSKIITSEFLDNKNATNNIVKYIKKDFDDYQHKEGKNA